jgi:polyribonucleotide nucleotidyltransferase
VDIDIEDSGLVFVTAPNAEGANKAIEWIKNLTREVVPGEHFMGKVTRIMDFGAFVEVLPKQEGLVHVSEIAPFRVEKVTDALNVGDVVPVIVKEIDSMGRINLTMLGTDFDTSKIKHAETPDPHRGFSARGGFGGGFHGGDRSRRPMGGGGRDRGPRRPRF